MHPRRQVAAPKTWVESHQANALASGKWRVTTFMLATSLQLSATSVGTQAPMWALGRRSTCMPWRREWSATLRRSTCPVPATRRLWSWLPGCPRVLCSIRLLSTWFL